MPAPLDFSPYIRATLASLQAELPDRIAVYNGEAANVHDLEVPITEAYYFGGDDTYVHMPKVEVAVPDGINFDFSTQQADAAQGLSVSVSVWLEGETGEIPEMHEKVLGYGRVVAEVLLVPAAFGGGVSVTEVTALYPMIPTGAVNPETRSFDKWRTLAVLEFTLNDVARRPL